MRKILQTLALGAAVLAFGAAAAADEFEYDVVIRNGRLLDGLGNPWVRASIAIKDGRIASIGRCAGRGRREIDARDHYVSPGWIDLMDQSGEVLPRNGLAENKLLQGVTTAIAGEGGTPVPAGEIDKYFRDLQASGISLNFGTYYSSAQARVAVMGDGAGRADAGATGKDEGAGRHRDARGRGRHRDRADLSARQLSIDARPRRARESGCAVQRHLRQPHAR